MTASGPAPHSWLTGTDGAAVVHAARARLGSRRWTTRPDRCDHDQPRGSDCTGCRFDNARSRNAAGTQIRDPTR